ncbi:unnamed protein product, partial [Hapterophycus canaliculatus]
LRVVPCGVSDTVPPLPCVRWVKFLEELFGNKFSLLLWAGAVLCFIGYSLQAVSSH